MKQKKKKKNKRKGFAVTVVVARPVALDAHAFAEVDVAWMRRKSGARVSLAKLFVHYESASPESFPPEDNSLVTI